MQGGKTVIDFLLGTHFNGLMKNLSGQTQRYSLSDIFLKMCVCLFFQLQGFDFNTVKIFDTEHVQDTFIYFIFSF